MSKKILSNKLHEKIGGRLKHNKVLVEIIIETLFEILLAEQEVNLQGFGKLYIKYRKEYNGRNPRTGEFLNIPAQNVVKFKSSKNLKKLVN